MGVKNNKVRRKWYHIIVPWFCKSCHDFLLRMLYWHLLSKIVAWFVKSPYDFNDIVVWHLLSKSPHDFDNIRPWRNHIFLCDFLPWEPPWLCFLTLNSLKSSLIVTLWLPYHCNTNSSLTYQIIHSFHHLIIWFTLPYVISLEF